MVTPSVLVALRLAYALGLGLNELIEFPPLRVEPSAAAIARILDGRATEELDLARRILVELFR
jgi:hypothetical protein